jgi:uroporphyrinogen-III synthase
MVLPVLILRPQPGADEMAAQLAKESFAPVLVPVLAPIFEISALPASVPQLSGFSGLIFTSANGVRQFAQLERFQDKWKPVIRPETRQNKDLEPGFDSIKTEQALSSERNLPVFAIGPRTAQCAMQAGFCEVQQFEGDRAKLIAALRKDASYLHLHGQHQAGDLCAEAGRAGISCQALAIYRSQAVDILPATARDFLQKTDSAPEGAIVFFSDRAAQTFNALLENQGLFDSTKHFYAVTISSSVADNLNPCQWKAISIAAKPDMVGVISALRHVSENKGHRPA